MKKPEPIVTFSDIINTYLTSSKYHSISPGSQQQYRRYLLLAEGSLIGTMPADQVKPKHIQAFLDSMSDRPGAQKSALTALKVLESFAAGPRELLPYPITTGVEIIGSNGGHDPWTEGQIALAVEHARPDLSRAIMLGAWTGQRISDLIKMAWTDIQEHEGRLGIHVVQKKTGRELWIPFPQPLAAAMATWERRPAPILLQRNGARWSRNYLTESWKWERENNPKLVDCRDLVFHGLRGSACVRLRRRQATEAEISAMVGMSVSMVTRYCRFADQQVSAMAAVRHLDEADQNKNGTVTQFVNRKA